MRFQIILFVFALCPLFLFGQSKSVKQFYNKYANYENVSDVTLQGWVLKMASNFADDETAERMLEKITKLRVLTMANGNLVQPADYRKLMREVRSDNFEDLIEIQSGTEKINMLIREDGETITDVVLFVNDADNFLLLSLEGALRFEDLQNINIDVDGSEHFKKIPKKRSELPRA